MKKIVIALIAACAMCLLALANRQTVYQDDGVYGTQGYAVEGMKVQLLFNSLDAGTWADTSGNGFNAVNNGGTASDGGMYCGGSDQGCYMNTSAGVYGGTSRVYSFWIKSWIDQVGIAECLMNYNLNTSDEMLTYPSGNIIYHPFQYLPRIAWDPTLNVTNTGWHHVLYQIGGVGVVSGGTGGSAKVYLDSTNQSLVFTSPQLQFNSLIQGVPVSLMYSSVRANSGIKGYIDCFECWEGTNFTAAEVTNIYKLGRR